jgi:membrane-associated protease RseP (regulator of RpoE activity)
VPARSTHPRPLAGLSALLGLLLLAGRFVRAEPGGGARDDPAMLPAVVVVSKPGDHVHVSCKVIHVFWSKTTHLFSAEFDEVDPHSILGKAGVVTGDEILSLNGTKVTKMTELEYEQALSSAGPVTIELRSSGKEPRVILATFPPNFWHWGDGPKNKSG